MCVRTGDTLMAEGLWWYVVLPGFDAKGAWLNAGLVMSWDENGLAFLKRLAVSSLSLSLRRDSKSLYSCSNFVRLVQKCWFESLFFVSDYILVKDVPRIVQHPKQKKNPDGDRKVNCYISFSSLIVVFVDHKFITYNMARISANPIFSWVYSVPSKNPGSLLYLS